MQNQENRGLVPELTGLPTDVKQYPLDTGWLLVSTVGMCFVPYPQRAKNEQTREAQPPQEKVEGKKNGKR